MEPAQPKKPIIPPRNKSPAETDSPRDLVPIRETANMVAEKLAEFSHAVWEWQDIKSFTIARIQEIIADHGLAPEMLGPPRTDISLPAIEAMRYSPLRHEIVYLIAATMDESRSEIAHPAFIEIIKQLTVDEIRLLSALPEKKNVIPLINLNYVDQIDQIKFAVRCVIPESIAEICSKKRAIPTYIDNLLRLKLVEMPSGLKIAQDTYYETLRKAPFLNDPDHKPPRQLRKLIERRVLRLTSFGEAFRTCCIDFHRLPRLAETM